MDFFVDKMPSNLSCQTNIFQTTHIYCPLYSGPHFCVQYILFANSIYIGEACQVFWIAHAAYCLLYYTSIWRTQSLELRTHRKSQLRASPICLVRSNSFTSAERNCCGAPIYKCIEILFSVYTINQHRNVISTYVRANTTHICDRDVRFLIIHSIAGHLAAEHPQFRNCVAAITASAANDAF